MKKRALPVERIMDEIREGMGDIPIMEKYGLSPEEYVEVVEKLKGLRMRLPSSDFVRPPGPEVRRKPVQRRAVPRGYMLFNSSVYDAHRPGVKGTLLDISERGVQITGIKTKVGDVRTLVIGRERYTPDSELSFGAVCRWFRETDETGECVAGFEIARMSADARRRLRKLLQELAFCEAGFR